MAKRQSVEMGVNLGFIEKIVLTDGTALENMQVLYQSPIPNAKQLSEFFSCGNQFSRRMIGPATPQWSEYPEWMIGNSLFQEAGRERA